MRVLIDSMDKEPNLPEFGVVQECPIDARHTVHEGFGFAGGGYGSYLYCDECCKVIAKTCEPLDS